MEFFVSKCDGVLMGADDESIEKLASVGTDSILKCTVKKNRNYENHKRYFAFVKTAFDMQSKYGDLTEFRTVIQMGAGYYKILVSPKGKDLFIPDSISFGDIEEEEFKILFKKVLNYYLAALSDYRVVTDDEFMQLLSFD